MIEQLSDILSATLGDASLSKIQGFAHVIGLILEYTNPTSVPPFGKHLRRVRKGKYAVNDFVRSNLRLCFHSENGEHYWETYATLNGILVPIKSRVYFTMGESNQ